MFATTFMIFAKSFSIAMCISSESKLPRSLIFAAVLVIGIRDKKDSKKHSFSRSSVGNSRPFIHPYFSFEIITHDPWITAMISFQNFNKLLWQLNHGFQLSRYSWLPVSLESVFTRLHCHVSWRRSQTMKHPIISMERCTLCYVSWTKTVTHTYPTVPNHSFPGIKFANLC